MIRVVMFDLGLTLIDAHDKPFAHVAEALATIKALKAADGKRLRACLVSDFTMAEPPNAAQKARALFTDYLALLAPSGLRPFFEPVQRCITLSTQAGAFKPSRVVFETALRRLQVKAALAECVLITENAAHVKAVRSTLHMKALQFGPAGAAGVDFSDWSQAPALLAHLIAPDHASAAHAGNTHAAVTARLAAQGMTVTALEAGAQKGHLKAYGHAWHPVSVPGEPGLQHVHMTVPVDADVSLGPAGEVHAKVNAPAREHVAEATAFAVSLAANQQIGPPGAPRAAGATHEITTDASGQRRLVRKRFSAV